MTVDFRRDGRNHPPGRVLAAHLPWTFVEPGLKAELAEGNWPSGIKTIEQCHILQATISAERDLMSPIQSLSRQAIRCGMHQTCY